MYYQGYSGVQASSQRSSVAPEEQLLQGVFEVRHVSQGGIETAVVGEGAWCALFGVLGVALLQLRLQQLLCFSTFVSVD
ncbi:hypothetical protein ACFVYJ_04770 [Pontibacter sp. JAM-7]|uniref:hypothetical protein n=1 Tax=Pontibacter sp. JAM-7 TaxID=3366581 RepID=UPI003AF6BDF6